MAASGVTLLWRGAGWGSWLGRQAVDGQVEEPAQEKAQNAKYYTFGHSL